MCKDFDVYDFLECISNLLVFHTMDIDNYDILNLLKSMKKVIDGYEVQLFLDYLIEKAELYVDIFKGGVIEC